MGSLYSTFLVAQKAVAMSSQAATRASALSMLTVCLHWPASLRAALNLAAISLASVFGQA